VIQRATRKDGGSRAPHWLCPQCVCLNFREEQPESTAIARNSIKSTSAARTATHRSPIIAGSVSRYPRTAFGARQAEFTTSMPVAMRRTRRSNLIWTASTLPDSGTEVGTRSRNFEAGLLGSRFHRAPPSMPFTPTSPALDFPDCKPSMTPFGDRDLRSLKIPMASP